MSSDLEFDLIRTDPAAGRLVFFPYNPTRQGYIVPDSASARRLDRAGGMLKLVGSLPLLLLLAVISLHSAGLARFPDWALFALAALMLMSICWREFATRRLVRGLAPSEYRLTWEQHQAEPVSGWHRCHVIAILLLAWMLLPGVLRNSMAHKTWGDALPQYFVLACVVAVTALAIDKLQRRPRQPTG